MKLVQRILNIEESTYPSILNGEALKIRLEDFFGQKRLGVDGKLTGANKFTVYDKWVVIGWDMPNLKRKAAYLYGEIEQVEKGTVLRLRVKPNPILPIFALLATLVGLTITVFSYFSTSNSSLLLAFGLFCILLGIVYYPLSTHLRNRLKNKVVEYLDLREAR